MNDPKSVNDKIRINTWLPRYAVLVHPMEMREGGLCNVEKRIFRELAGFIAPRRTGAVTAYVCDHPDMQPDQLVLDVMSGKFKLTDEEKTPSDRIPERIFLFNFPQ